MTLGYCSYFYMGIMSTGCTQSLLDIVPRTNRLVLRHIYHGGIVNIHRDLIDRYHLLFNTILAGNISSECTILTQYEMIFR